MGSSVQTGAGEDWAAGLVDALAPTALQGSTVEGAPPSAQPASAPAGARRPGLWERLPAALRPLPVSAARPRWWVELLIVGWLLWVYDAINNLAHLRYGLAIAHATDVLHLEQTLGIDPEHTLNLWMAHHRTLGVVSSYYYDNAHFIVTFGLLAWLWWRRADIYRPMRTALVLMNVIGLAVFWLYPVAPPRMLAGFTDVVANTGAVGSWHTGPLAHDANQLAAMPSLHMAWAAWCGLVLWQMTETVEGPDRSRETRAYGACLRFSQPVFDRLRHPLSPRVWVRVLAVLYPCLTCLAVLGTGNHFVLDILAGLATAALAVALAAVLSRVSARALPAAGTACHKLVTKSRIR
jgi:PAP2 superfamily